MDSISYMKEPGGCGGPGLVRDPVTPAERIARLEADLAASVVALEDERKERRRFERALAKCYILAAYSHRYAIFDKTRRLEDLRNLVRSTLGWPDHRTALRELPIALGYKKRTSPL